MQRPGYYKRTRQRAASHKGEAKKMKVVLIDDERSVLRVLKILLADYPEIEIAGMFTNPMDDILSIPALPSISTETLITQRQPILWFCAGRVLDETLGSAAFLLP